MSRLLPNDSGVWLASTQMVDYLVQLGVDLNMGDTLGMNALHHASRKGYDGITGLLLRAHAAVEVRPRPAALVENTYMAGARRAESRVEDEAPTSPSLAWK